MKKALLTTLALAVVSGALAQGTVTFSTRITGSLITQVFAPDTDPYTQKVGNTAANLPIGTQVYSGAALSGAGWTAQLFSITGNTLPSGPFTAYGVPTGDNFVAATPSTTFRTGTAAGNIANTTATLANVGIDAASAVLQMRVYPTSAGSWANAVALWPAGATAIGASPAFVVNAIGGSVNTPPNMDGIRSFSLVLAPVPEPSSFALAGMGIASLLIFRRRK